MSFDFSGKRVLVTGAANGIGHAICMYFANAGADIIAADIDDKELADLEKELSALSIKYDVIKADITKREEVKEKFQASEAVVDGAIDVLVNVAGGSQCQLLQDETEKSWQADLMLNLSGAYHCVEAVREQMLAQGHGVVINIGSVNGMATFGDPSYSAAKAGLISYTKSLAVEFGGKGLRCHIVCPGSVKTRLWEDRAKRNPEVFDEIRQWYPLGDIVEADDVAKAVGFLASDDAKMLTGIVMPVDAGLMAGLPAVVESITQRKL